MYNLSGAYHFSLYGFPPTIDDNGFSFARNFQPLWGARENGTPNLLGFEALSRMCITNTQTGAIDRHSIYPHILKLRAEGLLPKIDIAALRDAIYMISLHDRTQRNNKAPIFVTVNLDGTTLGAPELIEDIKSLLANSPSPEMLISRVRLELTEEEFPRGRAPDAKRLQNIRELSQMGFNIILDDYGENPETGYRLKDFSEKGIIQGLKLGEKFLKFDIALQTKFLHSLQEGSTVVLEMIETDEQFDLWRSLRSKAPNLEILAQGWHPQLGRDVPIDKTLDYVSTTAANNTPNTFLLT